MVAQDKTRGPGVDQDSEAQFLASYQAGAYPPVAVTADVAVLCVRQGQLCVLLVRRGGHSYQGCWALPGGFVADGEDLDEAATRELAEECGDGVAGAAHLEQLRTYGTPGRDPRMRVVTVAYVALVADAPAPEHGSDAADARWWPVADLGGEDSPEIAFDHAAIISDAVERARSRIEYTTLAATLTKEPFTIAELRRTYEAVWGVTLDPNNFRRKVLATVGFVTPDGGQVAGRGRPAPLWRKGAAAVMSPPMVRPARDTQTGGRRPQTRGWP